MEAIEELKKEIEDLKKELEKRPTYDEVQAMLKDFSDWVMRTFPAC